MANEITLKIIVQGPDGIDHALKAAESNGFEEVKGKEYSASQKMRFALRRKHLGNGGTDADFEPFYESQMKLFTDRVIQTTKK